MPKMPGNFRLEEGPAKRRGICFFNTGAGCAGKSHPGPISLLSVMGSDAQEFTPRGNYSMYDSETIKLLRTVLDEAWDTLRPLHREQISKSHMAVCVLRQAAKGERNRDRLRFRAIADAVQAVAGV